MKKHSIIKTHCLSIAAISALLSCGGSMACARSLCPEQSRIQHHFKNRLAEISDTCVTNYFSSPDSDGDTEVREAMEFLYAYMSLPDMLNNSPAFYERNVRMAMRAKAEMTWGKSVPMREFRHFVLPVRVNNEDLDDFRSVYYEELKERVNGMSMKDAILEINHWCHEKVTYQPADARTSSPLSTISQAIGRCGEESTFTVAALRAAGIPARQIYTPRWAHTDDNHAWVEAWADGQWWFLGACEPEPMLDMAWFNIPASRGMLMTTRVFGHYDGPEELLERTSCSSTINVTAKYAPVKKIDVMVRDMDGNSVADANVRFSLYNYAEYFPVASLLSDKEGRAALTAGEGDMVIWASDGTRFGITRANAGMHMPVVVTLDKDSGFEGSVEFDLTPPSRSASIPQPTAEMTTRNEARKAYEDSIRNCYTATFASADQAVAIARSLATDPEKTKRLLTESRGNHAAITTTLASLPDSERGRAVDMMLAASEKDRRDMPMDVVTDRLAIPASDSPLYNDYVLNPRVEHEGLRPFVREFLATVSEEEMARYRNNPRLWEEKVATDIKVDTSANPYNLRICPSAVLRAARADLRSREIFFVASARAMGIPARIDKVTGKTQWHDGDSWHDAGLSALSHFSSAGSPDRSDSISLSPRCDVSFSRRHEGRPEDPAYYTHFSISRIDRGMPVELEFDEGATLSSISANHPELDCGQYVVTTGQRMADGSVLARSTFLNVKPDNGPVDIPVMIRRDESNVQVIGGFNSENRFIDSSGQRRSILSATGRGYYTLVYGLPNHEPTAHVLNDISSCADGLEADGRRIMLIYPDAGSMARAGLHRFGSLPSTVTAGHDADGAIMADLSENLGICADMMPVVIVADTFNRVVYLSSGYTIGSGEQLLNILRRVED